MVLEWNGTQGIGERKKTLTNGEYDIIAGSLWWEARRCRRRSGGGPTECESEGINGSCGQTTVGRCA